MKNSNLILAVVFAVQALIPVSAEASTRSRKPWFGRSKTVTAKAALKTETVRVTYSGKNKTGAKIAQQALHYQGSKYTFGGTTQSKGFDCSGLVARVWADLQLKKIPRASSALYNSGKPVRLAELQEGDLVFFKNTYKSGISHVGVYTGKNKFVHAPSHKKRVSITRLSDPYYQLHYAGARRLY